MSSKFLVPLHLVDHLQTPATVPAGGFVKLYALSGWLKLMDYAGTEADAVLDRPLDGFILTTAQEAGGSDSVLSAIIKLQSTFKNLKLKGAITGTGVYNTSTGKYEITTTLQQAPVYTLTDQVVPLWDATQQLLADSPISVNPDNTVRINSLTAGMLVSDGDGNISVQSIPNTPPGGSNGQLQYNNSGAFAGLPLTYDNTTTSLYGNFTDGSYSFNINDSSGGYQSTIELSNNIALGTYINLEHRSLNYSSGIDKVSYLWFDGGNIHLGVNDYIQATSMYDGDYMTIARNGIYLRWLKGSGTRMVLADMNGLLSTQDMLLSAFTNDSGYLVATTTDKAHWDTAYGWGNHALAGYQSNITPGTVLQYYRGDKTWQTLDTSVVTENTNLYYTDTRARAAITNTVTGITYSAGAFSTTAGYGIPTTVKQTQWDTVYTLAGTAVTAGQVIYAGTAGVYSGSINATWDSTNSRLNIGVPTSTGRVNIRSSNNNNTTRPLILQNSNNDDLFTFYDNGCFLITNPTSPSNTTSNFPTNQTGKMFYYDQSKGAILGGYNSVAGLWVSVGTGSFAWGEECRATGTNSVAITGGAQSTGSNAVAIGNLTSSTVTRGMTFGWWASTTTVSGGITIGSGTSTSVDFVNNTGNIWMGLNSNIPTLVITTAAGTGTTGNVGIGTGTATLTSKLQVKGAGATSATIGLLVQDSANVTNFKITDNGDIWVRGLTNQAVFGGSDGRLRINRVESNTGNAIDIVAPQAAAALYGIGFTQFTTVAPSSGNYNIYQFGGTAAPTSTATVNTLAFTNTFDQSGGGTGITRSIYINPTLTTVTDYRAIGINMGSSTHYAIYQLGTSAKVFLEGKVYIGNSSPYTTNDQFDVKQMTSGATIGIIRAINNGGTLVFDARNDGNVYVTTLVGLNSTLPLSASSTVSLTGRNGVTTDVKAAVVIAATSDMQQVSGTSGEYNILEINPLASKSISPASGSCIFATTKIYTVVAQTGTASGITRGLWLSNTITSAADFRSFEITMGSAAHYAIYQTGANAKNYMQGELKVDGRFKPPQLSAAPSSPVNGEIYYDTTLNLTRTYENGAWRTI